MAVLLFTSEKSATKLRIMQLLKITETESNQIEKIIVKISE